jgi:hypothetical protein
MEVSYGAISFTSTPSVRRKAICKEKGRKNFRRCRFRPLSFDASVEAKKEMEKKE